MCKQPLSLVPFLKGIYVFSKSGGNTRPNSDVTGKRALLDGKSIYKEVGASIKNK